MVSSVAQAMAKMISPLVNGKHEEGKKQQQQKVQQLQAHGKDRSGSSFQMPLHYPRYTKADYEAMPEWKLNCLLREYGLPVAGDLGHKRSFAMGAFLWSSQ